MSARFQFDWFLSLSTLVGAILRLFQLGAQSLWLDEVFSVLLARRDWVAIVAGTAQDSKPPLYYFLLHIALQFGNNEVAARSVSLLFSIAMIPFFYALESELLNKPVAR